MRGFVYRLGRRRAGLVLPALAAALTFAVGSGSAALARNACGHGSAVRPAHRAALTAAHRSPANSVRAPGNSVRASAKPVHVAHAAGHKIA